MLPNPGWNVVAFEVPTAAKWNQLGENDDALADGSALQSGIITNDMFATGAGEPGGAWTSWTPTLTNLSGGTLQFAVYTQIGKTVIFRFLYDMLGANVAGSVDITLPLMAHANYSSSVVSIGNAHFEDANGSWALGYSLIINNNTKMTPVIVNTGGTYGLQSPLSSTAPFTWAGGDAISMQGAYQIA